MIGSAIKNPTEVWLPRRYAQPRMGKRRKAVPRGWESFSLRGTFSERQDSMDAVPLRTGHSFTNVRTSDGARAHYGDVINITPGEPRSTIMPLALM